MKYYVYKATLDSIVVYIGKGSGDRYKHLVSGISSNYDANKAHFSGQVVDLEIVEYFECEDFAYKRETELIYELAPLWNYQIRGVRIDPTKPPKTYKSRGVQYMPNKRIKQWRAYSRHPETRAKVHISYHMTEDEAYLLSKNTRKPSYHSHDGWASLCLLFHVEHYGVSKSSKQK